MAIQDGILVIDKPLEITSHDVVAKVRKILQTKKVGHAGTLDPQASGVLVLGINRGTRLMQYLVGDDKEYQATIRLGITTVSDDASGEVIAITPNQLTHAEILAVLPKFLGQIMQRPSSVSAIKVNGVRAHDLVRSGVDLVLPERAVTVHRIDLLSVEPVKVDGVNLTDIKIEVECSSGTYVRALARDLGSVLGVGGSVQELRRTRSGKFELAEAVSLSDLTSESNLFSLGDIASRVLTCFQITTEQVQDLAHGREISVEGADVDEIAMLDSHLRLAAVGKLQNGKFQPANVFITPTELTNV